ncbi:MAG: porin [Betaproteobacteria bacterium]|nr:porin [Betaproteobacteria bacterium]
MMKRIKLRPGALAVAMALGATMVFPVAAHAEGQQDEVNALKEQMRVLMKKLEDLTKKQESQEKKQDQIEKQVSSAPASGGGGGDKLDKILKGFYGVMDASIDDTTKGMGGMTASHFPSGPTPGSFTQGGLKAGPVGRMGWMPQLSTNKSGFGYRGDHMIGDSDVKFIYQFETAVSITATPGLSGSYTSQSNTARGLVGFGDTFIGLKQGDWGSLKFGTTYTPYKKATDRLNPFSGMLGDYAVVMGNSGGDNRVEFGTRQDHSIWWESNKYNGFSMDMLYSPGQNRTYDNVVTSAGSPDCNGGNIPGSGNLPMNCDDGGFNNSFSTALKYESQKFYATAAYELHQGVNRNSDGIGANNQWYGAPTPAMAANIDSSNPLYGPSTVFGVNGGTPPYINDIGNEWAVKLGAQYKFDFGLTVSGIVERLRRDIPASLEFQNERSRDGTWLALTQTLSPKDELSAGWAHAGATPGDPGGQHNYDPTRGANTADMYTVAYKRQLDKQLFWYFNAATTVNHGNAHYDLGAGGRGVTTDCHDGTNSPTAGSLVTDGTSNGPTTWGGCHLIGVSTGLHFKF